VAECQHEKEITFLKDQNTAMAAAHHRLVAQAVLDYRETLEELAKAERSYRTSHDDDGPGAVRTGRAWDRLRKAGDAARALLEKKEVPHAT
jgi:hypothetical protein